MDVEKTMQFLLEQQARFDARQAQYEARQAQYEARHAEFEAQSEERMTSIQNLLFEVATAQTGTSAILAALTDRHVELAGSHKALSEAQRVTAQNLRAFQTFTEQNLKALSEAQRATEQNLKAFQTFTEQNLKALSEAQGATEQSLKSLASAVERHIESHN